MTEAYEFAELLKSAALKAYRADNPCDVVTLRINTATPLSVSLPGGARLPAEKIYVCSFVKNMLTDGAAALAIKSAGGQRYYIFDITEGQE